jgi:hypothetical protein
MKIADTCHDEYDQYDSEDVQGPNPQNLCFTRKLYNIVSDERNQHIIAWHKGKLSYFGFIHHVCAS